MKNAFLAILLIAIILLIILIAAFPFYCCAAETGNTLKGRVTDGTGRPLQGVVVQIADQHTGTVTDSSGNYFLANLMAGKWQVNTTAISYESTGLIIYIIGNTVQNFVLHDNKLQEVTVTGSKKPDLLTVSQTAINAGELFKTRGATLGEALKQVPGLNAIQTGPSLFKPVIHGMHSNRVLIINNGVRQEGQQWGSEHAPEIDAFSVNKITIVKGAASVRYGSDAVGGVVILAPPQIEPDNRLTGNLTLLGASNGKMVATSGYLSGSEIKEGKGFYWSAEGTLKQAGNFHTPRYYLTNSGLKEGDYSLCAGYKYKALDTKVSFSSYDNKVGIFWGAESGNITELIQKFALPTPGLPSYFTYQIARPYQSVTHQVAKILSELRISDKSNAEVTFARQNDIRQEYDEIASNNTAALNSPQLRFQLVTHSLEMVYNHLTSSGFSTSAGVTGLTSGNVFEGVRSLIPNYRDYNAGAFVVEQYHHGKFTLECGFRYDYRWLRVYERNQTTLDLYNVTYQYTNATGTLGASYKASDYLRTSLNIGKGWRAPSINEMYIYGEHFSDGSFEVGDSTLKTEHTINTGWSVRYAKGKLQILTDAYCNLITNYIYDKPALKYRVLPSGTFPEFDFTQANVVIAGLDADLRYEVSHRFTLQSKTTIVRGYNESINNWLISMPCDRFENGIEFHLPEIGSLQQPYLSVVNVSVMKQIRVPPNSDYVPPPGAYSLMNMTAGFSVPMGGHLLAISITANNLLNTVYRDYLDHFRYYSDEIGANYIIRFKYSF